MHLVRLVYGPHVDPDAAGVGCLEKTPAHELYSPVPNRYLERIVGRAQEPLQTEPAKHVENSRLPSRRPRGDASAGDPAKPPHGGAAGGDHEGSPSRVSLAQDPEDRRLDARAVRLHIDIDDDSGEFSKNLIKRRNPKAPVRRVATAFGA